MTPLGHTVVASGAKVVRTCPHRGVPCFTVYVGLGLIGHVIPNAQSYSDSATQCRPDDDGMARRIVFGLIVLTACMTTAVGLIAAASSSFRHYRPSPTARG